MKVYRRKKKKKVISRGASLAKACTSKDIKQNTSENLCEVLSGIQPVGFGIDFELQICHSLSYKLKK